MNFKSCSLWEKYIEFEKARKNYQKVGELYWRLMHVPTEKLHDYYSRFKLFIEARGRKMEHYGVTLPEYNSSLETTLDPDDPRNFQADFQTKKDMLYYSQCEELRTQRIREIVRTYEKTLVEYNKRRLFEQNIKRTFFHAKALDEKQLDNWRQYLTFEENEGNDQRITLLYERCIIPLCYYAEFWMRYSVYLNKTRGPEASRALFNKANSEFLKRRYEGFVMQGHFEEMLGNTSKAKEIYKHVYQEVAPGLFEAIFKHINLERRENNLETVENLYSKCFQIAEESKQEALIVFVSMQYADYQFYTLNQKQAVIETYEEALRKVKSRKALYLAYIDSLKHLTDHQERLQRTKDTLELAISEESKVSCIRMMSSYMIHDCITG